MGRGDSAGRGSCASVFHGVSDISFRIVCRSLPRLSRACALVLGPPPPPRQAASGCNADRLPVCARGSVRAEVRVRVRLGSEGFVRRRQGVRRSWPSERYMCAQRRSSLEQKSWVKVLVIRPGAGCRVPGAGRVWRREARAEGGGAYPCNRRCDLTLTPTPTLDPDPSPNLGLTRARGAANRERLPRHQRGRRAARLPS